MKKEDTILWCDERFPELEEEIKLLWFYIAQYEKNQKSDKDIGDLIDRTLANIIIKSKGTKI